MVAHMARMRVHMLLAVFLVVRLDGVQIAFERRLRVDDDRFPAGKTHDHVGPQTAVLPAYRLLLHEIHVFRHACHLQYVPQLMLSPPAPGLRLPERLDEAAGLRAQVRLALRQALHLLVDGAVGSLPRLLDLVHLALEFDQALADRLDQRFNCGLAFLQVFVRARLVRLEALAHEVQEVLAVLPEDVRGERLEFFLDCGAHLLQFLDARSMALSIGLQAGLRFREILPGRFQRLLESVDLLVESRHALGRGVGRGLLDGQRFALRTRALKRLLGFGAALVGAGGPRPRRRGEGEIRDEGSRTGTSHQYAYEKRHAEGHPPLPSYDLR